MIPSETAKEIREHAMRLVAADGERDKLFDKMDEIYHMKDDELPSADWIKRTISPDGRNALDGAARLLSAAEPHFSVPRETNMPDVWKVADQLERSAHQMWRQAGLVATRPRHYDAIKSGLLYSEVHIVVTSTKSLVNAMTKPGERKRAERAARKTPALFDTVNPREGHAEWDQLGLVAYCSKREMTVADIRSRWGSDKLPDMKSTDKAVVWDYWNLEWHMAWVDGKTENLIGEENRLGVIPVAAVICEGSFLFTGKDQDIRQPFLYTVYKSNLWKRQNLYMTVTNSLVFAIGSNPLMIYESDSEEPVPDYDNTMPGGVIKLQPGEKYYPLMEKIISPDLTTQGQMIDDRFVQSTIYRQVLGEPLGANAPFSMVSLLSQAGRLPLIVYQRMISWAITIAIKIAFEIARVDGATLYASSKTGLKQIAASEIPEEFDIEANLDIDLPQDKRMNAQIAIEGWKAGLWSLRYARELVQIGQSVDMTDEIWEERYAELQNQIDMEIEKQEQLSKAQSMKMNSMAPGEIAPDQLPPDAVAGQRPAWIGPQSAMPGMPLSEPQQPMGSPEGPGAMPPGMLEGGL